MQVNATNDNNALLGASSSVSGASATDPAQDPDGGRVQGHRGGGPVAEILQALGQAGIDRSAFTQGAGGASTGKGDDGTAGGAGATLQGFLRHLIQDMPKHQAQQTQSATGTIVGA